MIAVRVDNLLPGGAPRRVKLYELLGQLEIRPTKIKEDNTRYFVIIDEKYLEKILENESKEKMKREGFEVHVPLEYTAMKTVIIKQIDQIVDFYDDEQIATDIGRTNAWAEVEKVFKMPTTSKMIKVTFRTVEMAQKAKRDGIFVLNQSITSKNVEKEIFVKIKPCYNCFSYKHVTKNCTEPKRTLCSQCGFEGHRQNTCRSETYKCLNCGGDHRTLAARCPVRKKEIKDRTKEQRERSRSRSRARTYASATATNAQQQRTNQQNQENIRINQETRTMTKDIVTTILAAITYGHYKECLMPGTFQATMDTMLALNGLPKIKFPMNDLVQETEGIMRDLSSEVKKKQRHMQERETEEEPREEREREEREKQTEEEMMDVGATGIDINVNKRTRESLTGEEENKKQRQRQRQYEEKTEELREQHYPKRYPPAPPPHRKGTERE